MSLEPSSALAVAPTGEVIDGRRLLAEAVGFGRALRAAGLAVDMAASIDFARALTLRRPRQQGHRPGRGGRAVRAAARRPRGLRPGVRPVLAAPRAEAAEAAARGPRARRRARRGGRSGGRRRGRRGPRRDDVGAGHDGRPGRLRQRGGRRDRGRDDLARRVLPRRAAAPPRLRPDDLRRAARRRALRRPAAAAARAPADPAVRAPPARPPGGPAGDVPPEPGHRRADRMGLAAPDPRAAPARRPVRHLGLDGAALAAAPAVRPGAVAHERGAHGVVRVRDAPDPRDPADARPRPGPRPRARRRHGHRLGGRDPDRGVVPGLQPPLGAADAADVGRRDRGLRRLGPWRPGARRRRDRAAPPQLPPPRVAQPARVGARLPAARGRHEGGVPVHRRLPPGRHARVARAAGRGAERLLAGDRPARIGRHARDVRRAVARPGRAGCRPPRPLDAAAVRADQARPLT